jgi:hypothetical protein
MFQFNTWQAGVGTRKSRKRKRSGRFAAVDHFASVLFGTAFTDRFSATDAQLRVSVARGGASAITAAQARRSAYVAVLTTGIVRPADRHLAFPSRNHRTEFCLFALRPQSEEQAKTHRRAGNSKVLCGWGHAGAAVYACAATADKIGTIRATTRMLSAARGAPAFYAPQEHRLAAQDHRQVAAHHGISTQNPFCGDAAVCRVYATGVPYTGLSGGALVAQRPAQ